MRERANGWARGLLILLALGMATAVAAEDPGGKGAVAGDSGFRANPNGFNFPNWGGGENQHGDLTVDDARCLFGDAVCARVNAGKCEPTPAARVWIEQMNQMMAGGHCEGLAALSAAFHAGKRDASLYGSSKAYELQVRDANLLRMISTLFVTQALEPVQSVTAETKSMSTKQIVDTLARSFKDKSETYTLGIYGAEGGHAITPYAVEDVGGGKYLIHVYDNNYPGAGNVVEVDTGADTWRYSGAALNPGEPASPWEGTGGSMDLTPLSSRFQPLQCPFCATQSSGPMCVGGVASSSKAPAAAPGAPGAPARPPSASPQRGPTSVQTTANCDQVSVKEKKSGKTTAFAKGKMVGGIPKAVMTRRRGARGCAVTLPPGADYDVAVAGRPGQAKQPVETTIMRPGQVFNLEGSTVSAGQTESMGIGDTSFSFRPSSDSKPNVTMATDNPDGKDGLFEVTNLDLGAGHVFTVNETADGRITFDSDDPDLDHFDVDVTLEDEAGKQDFDFDNVDFDDQGQAILGPGAGGGLVFDMDSDSDGTIDGRDQDDDNDGTPDARDADDDGDGTLDAKETDDDDADGDGTPDAKDADDDNDGTPDARDNDDDGDGTSDATDADDDNDGTPDAQEDGGDDADHDGTPDDADADDDNDGTPDANDTDDDGDGTPDASDNDDDNDGVPDAQDEGDEDDADHDGTPDDADADDDNDGTPDATDVDDDGDGTADAADNDDDNDGTPDAEEEADEAGGEEEADEGGGEEEADEAGGEEEADEGGGEEEADEGGGEEDESDE